PVDPPTGQDRDFGVNAINKQNPITTISPVECMNDDSCLSYAQSLANVSTVLSAVVLPTIATQSSDSSLGVLSQYRPDQITVVTSATCRDACASVVKAVSGQRLGVIVTLGAEDTTAASSPATVLEDTGCYKSPTMGQFNVPLATAETANTVWSPSDPPSLRVDVPSPNMVYSRGWGDTVNLTTDLAGLSAYIAGENGWPFSSGVSLLKPKTLRTSGYNLSFNSETQSAVGTEVTMVSGLFVDDSENGDTATYTMWSCAEGDGLRLMGPRLTAEGETAPLCASLVPSRLDTFVSVSLSDTRFVVALGGALLLAVAMLSLVIRQLQKRVSKNLDERAEIEATVRTLSVV
ncbi:hypothetical protein KIPB_007325, partial [Kipferlia bialata]